jgi:endonuclease/exonuclease/phosphatase (EEP) superfamily protein YafD
LHSLGEHLVLWPFLGTVIAFFSSQHWFLELFCHFVPFYLLGVLCGLSILLLLRSWRWAGLGLVCVLINLVHLVPWYVPLEGNNSATQTPNLRILHANVLTSNPSKSAFLTLVERTDPDIIVVQEVDAAWEGALQELNEDYPHSVCLARRDNFGIAQYSRIGGARDPERVRMGEIDLPALMSTFQVNGRLLTLFNVHTLPPVGYGAARIRNQQIEALTALVAQHESSVIVSGDLNATPWSPHYARLEAEGKLNNTRKGFGVLGTWPTGLPLKIPLDHVLVSSDIQTVSCRVGPHIGSDHLPLIVDLYVPPSGS